LITSTQKQGSLAKSVLLSITGMAHALFMAVFSNEHLVLHRIAFPYLDIVDISNLVEAFTVLDATFKESSFWRRILYKVFKNRLHPEFVAIERGSDEMRSAILNGKGISGEQEDSMKDRKFDLTCYNFGCRLARRIKRWRHRLNNLAGTRYRIGDKLLEHDLQFDPIDCHHHFMVDDSRNCIVWLKSISQSFETPPQIVIGSISIKERKCRKHPKLTCAAKLDRMVLKWQDKPKWFLTMGEKAVVVYEVLQIAPGMLNVNGYRFMFILNWKNGQELMSITDIPQEHYQFNQRFFHFSEMLAKHDRIITANALTLKIWASDDDWSTLRLNQKFETQYACRYFDYNGDVLITVGASRHSWSPNTQDWSSIIDIWSAINGKRLHRLNYDSFFLRCNELYLSSQNKNNTHSWSSFDLSNGNVTQLCENVTFSCRDASEKIRQFSTDSLLAELTFPGHLLTICPWREIIIPGVDFSENVWKIENIKQDLICEICLDERNLVIIFHDGFYISSLDTE